MDICIGIDLGTTFSAVSYWNGDKCEIIPNKDGKNITPSWVSFTNKEILIGDAAKATAQYNPDNTLYDIKRIIGKRYSDEQLLEDISLYPFNVFSDANDIPNIKVKYCNEEIILKPEQISAYILSYLKETAEIKLGTKVTKAVITVPAYFNNSQREATKQAARIAGLDCLRIINEPTAACLCYGIDKKYTTANILVFDLGGGTFDVSILKVENGIFEVLSTSGNTHLGGEDFDYILCKYILEDYEKKMGVPIKKTNKNMRKVKSIAEKAKCMLSNSISFIIELDVDGNEYMSEITRSFFENLCKDIFLTCIEPVKLALKDAKLDKSKIDEIVLVGGSTRIPKIRELLSEYFNGKQLNYSVHPDEAVALGAGIQGAILTNTDASEKTKDILLLDIIPLSLGIETKGDIFSKIIEKNSQIPTKKSKMYSTSEDKQTSIHIKVFEGERDFCKDNHKIADFELTDIPKLPRGVPKIEVSFEIDGDGLLSVYACEINTGINNKIIVKNSTKLTQEEINKMIDDAEKYRCKDELKKAALNSKYNYEKYLYQIQKAINDKDYLYDDNGTMIFTEMELISVNNSILSNLEWLLIEDLTKEHIDETRQIFEHNIKGFLNKIYLRKEQLELKLECMEKEKPITNDEAVNYINNNIH